MRDIRKQKNRTKFTLDVLDIQVEHADGLLETDPNGVVGMFAFGEGSRLNPLSDVISEISGDKAFLVRFDNIEVALSFEEMDRFFRRALKKDEYFYLLDRFGMFHEIHEDFYELDGTAVQPIDKPRRSKKRVV